MRAFLSVNERTNLLPDPPARPGLGVGVTRRGQAGQEGPQPFARDGSPRPHAGVPRPELRGRFYYGNPVDQGGRGKTRTVTAVVRLPNDVRPCTSHVDQNMAVFTRLCFGQAYWGRVPRAGSLEEGLLWTLSARYLVRGVNRAAALLFAAVAVFIEVAVVAIIVVVAVDDVCATVTQE